MVSSALLLVLVLIASIYAQTGIPGSPVPIATSDPGVEESVQFAIGQLYPGNNAVVVNVLSATVQVVNGKLYAMLVQVTAPPAECETHSISVWIRAGPSGIFLMQNTVVSNACVIPKPPPPPPYSIAFNLRTQ